MRKLWTTRVIGAPPGALWQLIADPEQWPEWGPTVRSADLQGEQLELGATGTVTTMVGLKLGFEITDYVEGERWAWKVAGVAATDHVVEPSGADECKVSFGVPWPAAPYLAVCQLALQRLDTVALREGSSS